ncbi:MAG: hypothetical protein J6K86_03570, partial [Clostridia bacterium]|nr:hypothetical protein [Clostridia bacterium]
YVSAARFGNYSDTEMRIFDASFNVLPYYDGDVTAVGYAAGTKLTAATTTNGWDHRVRVNGDLNFDFVDLQFSVSSEVGSTTVWMYGVDGAMLTCSYSVSTSGVTPSEANGPAKIIQFFDANGHVTSVAKFAANTVYTLRVYLDGATAFDFGMFNVSVTMYFGKISYGNVTDLAETVQIEVEEGCSFALPTTIEGTVTSVTLEGKEILSRVEDGKAIINGSAVTAFGQEKVLLIETTEGTYSLYADVATKFITTADELKALGVGGNRTNTADITGYYALANDITFEHAADYSDLVAAGYPKNGDYYFKGTFDGFGHTLYNIRVSDGGIFGLMRGATVKNLNMENVYLIDNPPSGVSNQDGGYMAILAFSAPSSVFENINITIASSPNAWTWKRDGLFVCSSSWGAATYRNITVDASGLKLKTLLGISHNANNVYENVVITAADYVAIGYTADSYATGSVQNTAALMSEFPAGVTFIRNSKLNVVQTHANATLLVYTGDETALGFAEGTTVYEAVQDNRKAMWANANTGETGTGDLGLTMEAQRIRITKGLEEDYASIQFSLSREMTGTYAFFAWYIDSTGARHGSNVYLRLDGKANQTTADGMTVIALDMDGKPVTSFAANTAYEMRWYGKGVATAFEIGCCVTSGNFITTYFANPSSGSGQLINATNNAGTLPIYTGDVTKLGFEEGTSVQYRTEEHDLVGGAGNWWQTGTAVEINGETLDCSTNLKRQLGQPIIYADANYDVVCIEFALSEAVASGNVFHVWAYDEAAAPLGNTAVRVGQAWAESGFAGAIYDKDGN